MTVTHILTGLPRSGSTLLANLLVQHPDIECRGTSGQVGVLAAARNALMIPSALATAAPGRNGRVLRAIANAFESEYPDGAIVIDKQRSWAAEHRLARQLFGPDVRFIATVRDLADVMASMERVWQQNAGLTLQNEPAMQTLDGRMEAWSSESGVVGSAYNGLKALMASDAAVLLVEYEQLTNDPTGTLRQVETHLGLSEWSGWSPDNVVQTIHESDLLHGFDGLHDITEGPIKPRKSRAMELLGPDLVSQIAGQEFWRHATI